MLILLTNDDGHGAAGLHAAREALLEVGEVVTVAPAVEMSGVSHAITLGRPLGVERVGESIHSVEGTPADCVTLAVQRLLPRPPDVVVSGINHGPNLGDDATCSGTVGAAVEAALLGLPAIAVSQVLTETQLGFDGAARLAAALARELGSARAALPKGTLLCVNAPPGDATDAVATRLARRTYLADAVGEERDDEGRSWYWLGGRPIWEAPDGTDRHAIESGRASLSLLRTDMDAQAPAIRWPETEAGVSLVAAAAAALRTGRRDVPFTPSTPAGRAPVRS